MKAVLERDSIDFFLFMECFVTSVVGALAHSLQLRPADLLTLFAHSYLGRIFTGYGFCGLIFHALPKLLDDKH